MDFIDDHEATQPLERGHRLLEALQIARVLEIESLASPCGAQDLTSERGLPRLPRSEQRDDRALAQERARTREQRRALDERHP